MNRIRRIVALARTDWRRERNLDWARRNFRRGDWRFALEKPSNYGTGIVLSYHRVDRFPRAVFCPTRGLTVPTGDFEAHLSFLKRHFTLIPLAQLVRCLREGEPLPNNFAVLTFDDGYESNYTDVLPLLVAYDVPATVFVTVGLIGGQEPLWHDRLEALLSQAERFSIAWPDGDGRIEFPLRSIGERWYAYERISERLVRMPAGRRADLLSELERRTDSRGCPDSGPPQRLLTWAQLREMRASGLVEIGSHSMRHQVLATLDQADADQEIGESRRRIQAETGSAAALFAYPNGTFHDFTQSNVEQLQAYGFDSACTQEPGMVTGLSDPYRIPRLDAAGMPLEALVMRMAGLIKRSAPEFVKFA